MTRTLPMQTVGLEMGDIVAQLRNRITRRQAVLAIVEGNNWLVETQQDPDDVDFWFHMFLAAGLSGQRSETQVYLHRMASCTGYRSVAADLMRQEVDLVLTAYPPHKAPIGFGYWDLAGRLGRAKDMHRGSPQQQVADLVTWARLCYKYRYYMAAYMRCEQAYRLAAALKHPLSPKLSKRLRFILMCVCLRLGEDYQHEAGRLAGHIARDHTERETYRRNIARYVRRTPYIARMMLDREERRYRGAV